MAGEQFLILLCLATGASIGLAGLLLLKSQGEFLEGLVYGDTGLGDYAAAVLWAIGLYFCSPYQLLLLFLGKIETERPSDWILQKLGKWTGQRSDFESTLASLSRSLHTCA